MSGDLWDEQEVVALVNTITNDAPFVERDAEYEHRRDLLYQRRFVSIPGVTVDAYGSPRESMLQFRSPEIEDHAHDFKNRMLAAPLKINVAATRKTQKAEDSAQRQEDFFYRHYNRWRDKGVFDGILFDMASIGVGWSHLSLNTELLPIVPDWQPGDDIEQYFELSEEEIRKFTEDGDDDLFVLEHIDPNTMYWSPDESVLVQKAIVPLNPLVLQYGRKGLQLNYDDKTGTAAVTTLDPGENPMVSKNNWARQVTLYTVEVEDYCYHVMMGKPQYGPGPVQPYSGGTVLGAYKNYFGVPAFFKCVGEKTGSAHPLYRYRPLLNGKYQTVPVKNVLITSQLTAGAEAAQQRYALKWIGQGNPPEDDYNVQVNVTEDGIVQPPAGYELVNTGFSVGPDLVAALQHMEKIDVYGFPNVLSRPDEVTATSGYDRAKQQETVGSLLDPPLGHFATMLTQSFKAMLSGVAEIGLPVTVRSTQTQAQGNRKFTVQTESTLSPDDLKEDTEISLSFDSVSLSSRIAFMEEGRILMQADQLNETEFQLEYKGITDMQDFRDQRALDKVLKQADDLAVAAVNEVVAKIKDAVAQKAIADNGVQVPMPPAGGVPAMVPTNGEALRSDRGPGIPIGPGQSMGQNGQQPAGAPVALG